MLPPSPLVLLARAVPIVPVVNQHAMWTHGNAGFQQPVQLVTLQVIDSLSPIP